MIVFIRLKHLNCICFFSLQNNSSYLSFWFISIKHIRPYQAHNHHNTKFFTMFQHTSDTIVEFRCVNISIIIKVLINSVESCWVGLGYNRGRVRRISTIFGPVWALSSHQKMAEFRGLSYICLIYSIPGPMHISSFDLGR